MGIFSIFSTDVHFLGLLVIAVGSCGSIVEGQSLTTPMSVVTLIPTIDTTSDPDETAATPAPTPAHPESGATLTQEATMAIDSHHGTVADLVADVAFLDAMQMAGALAFDVDPSMVKVQISEDAARRRLSIDVRSSMHRRLAVVNVKVIYTISHIYHYMEVAQVEAVEARMISIASSTSETNPLKQEISAQISSLPAVSAVTVQAISAPNLSYASSTPLSSPAPPAAPTSAAPSPAPSTTTATLAPTLTPTTPVVAPTASPMVTHTSSQTFDPTPLPPYEELMSSANKRAIESSTYLTAMVAVMLHVFILGLVA